MVENLFKRKKGLTKVELQFVDLIGNLRSIEVNFKSYQGIKRLGKGFDGSSIGFVPIEKSDLLLKPIEETFFRLPWDKKTARVLSEIFRPAEEVEDFSKERELEISPRYILKKVLERAKERGFEFFVAPEMEFFILKERELIDPPFYFSPTPNDKGAEFRRKLFDVLLNLGIEIEYSHHEVSGGQQEITLKHAPALKSADNIVAFRYLAKNLAFKEGLSLTFMPKPFSGMNGSGMHIHLSLFKDGKNLFFGKERISDSAKSFLAGILKHAKSISAIAASAINSYKRLIPGYEAPVNICWGFMNRTSMIRIPAFSNKDSARVELRMPDPLTNPYLLFACVLSAGMEGIEQNLDPGESCKINTYKNEERFKKLPKNLEEALDEMEKDKLIVQTLGKAFELYIKLKRKDCKEYKKIQKDWDPLKITEWEFKKYFNFI